MKKLHERVAIVTGASRGIGASIAKALAKEGCNLALAARSQARLTDLAGALAQEYGIDTLVIPTDVADEAAVRAMVAQTEHHFGRVDILVNNAGMGIYGAVDEVDMADLRHVFDVNLFGAIAGMQAVTPIMRRQGEGTIVNVSSIVGKFPSPLGGGYTATKFAMQGASGAARAELAKDNIDVILVCPGLTETEFSQHSTVSVPGVVRQEGESFAPMAGISPDRVGKRTVQAIKRGEREVFITWYDRLLVLAYQLFPAPFDWGLGIYSQLRRQRFAQLQKKSMQAREGTAEDGQAREGTAEDGQAAAKTDRNVEDRKTEDRNAEESTEQELVIALTVPQLLSTLAVGAVSVGVYLWSRRKA